MSSIQSTEVAAARLEQARTMLATARGTVSTLRDREKQLSGDLDAIANELRSGNTKRMSEAAGIVAQKSEVARELTLAEAQLQSAQESCARLEMAEKKARFQNLIQQARAQRTEIRELVKDACIKAGLYWTTIAELCQLRNSLRTFAGDAEHGFLAIPDSAELQELLQVWDPTPEILDSGFQLVTHLGWNFKISIVPIEEKIKKEQQQ